MVQSFALPTTRRGGLLLERALLRGPRGMPALRQRMVGTDDRIIVTHRAGLAAVVEVTRGQLFFLLGERALRAPTRFVLVVPQRSLLRLRFDDAEVHSDGLGVFAPLGGSPHVRRARPDVSLELASLVDGTLDRELPCDLGIDAATARARHALHEHMGELAPVRRAARCAGVCPDTLTRSFSKAYGITPKRYCTRARLFDAALQLLDGADILQAAFDSHFGDVSRFYAQFRSLLGATPGRYRAIGKRQDSSAPSE